MRDRDHLEHSRKPLEAGGVDAAVVADESDGRALAAGDRPSVVAHLPDDPDDAVDLIIGRVVLHDDEHVLRSPRVGGPPRIAGLSLYGARREVHGDVASPNSHAEPVGAGHHAPTVPLGQA